MWGQQKVLVLLISLDLSIKMPLSLGAICETLSKYWYVGLGVFSFLFFFLFFRHQHLWMEILFPQKVSFFLDVIWLLLIADFKNWHENCFVEKRQFCVYVNYKSYILLYGIACLLLNRTWTEIHGWFVGEDYFWVKV